ncbi:MAG: hypothetical protein NVS1B4_12250 [Gemmatimonadaceae bacterium]
MVRLSGSPGDRVVLRGGGRLVFQAPGSVLAPDSTVIQLPANLYVRPVAPPVAVHASGVVHVVAERDGNQPAIIASGHHIMLQSDSTKEHVVICVH